MHKLVFALIILTGSVQALAQDYVVTLQNDTLYGKVEILLPDRYTESLNLSTSQEKKSFKSHEIKAAFHDSVAYHTVKHLGKYRIMKLIEGGYLNYYLYRPDDSYNYGQPYLQKVTSEGMEVPNIGFRKRMVDFLSNCPEVVTKLEEKDYRKSDMREIVAHYNSCVQKQTENKYEAVSKMTSEVQLIENIKAKIQDNEHKELMTLLNDIKEKVRDNEVIPGYLINALKETTKNMASIESEVKQLLKTIEK